MFPILFRELREHEKSFDIENPRDFAGILLQKWELQLYRITAFVKSACKLLYNSISQLSNSYNIFTRPIIN